MFGSLFIGLSGMTAYSDGLRQVSNNITNLNTSGFRASTVGFNDLFQGNSGGISYSTGEGFGDGVSLGERRLDFSQGELRQSERDLDLAVEGNGFLVLDGGGGDYFYARTGSFEVDQQGYIVLSGTDYRLTVMDEAGRPQALSIDANRTSAPQATTTITFSDNLSSTADEFIVPDVNVYNELGEQSTWEIRFDRDDDITSGEWAVNVFDEDGDEVGSGTIRFTNGLIDPDASVVTIESEELGTTVELDFSENVTSFSSGNISTLRSSDVDGYPVGDITSLRVNEDGVLEISYSNEQTHELGAVTLADFRNPQDLEQRSGGLFTYDSSVGREFFTAESERVGQVQSNRLEASNVDLSSEFGDLILVQRGFQASSQVVSVSNDMIQQLFGIRGQG